MCGDWSSESARVSTTERSLVCSTSWRLADDPRHGAHLRVYGASGHATRLRSARDRGSRACRRRPSLRGSLLLREPASEHAEDPVVGRHGVLRSIQAHARRGRAASASGRSCFLGSNRRMPTAGTCRVTTFGKKSRKVRAERDRLADERERYRRLYVEMLEESPCWPQI